MGGLAQSIMDMVGVPEPIFDQKKMPGTDSPAWKKRQIRNQILRAK